MSVQFFQCNKCNIILVGSYSKNPDVCGVFSGYRGVSQDEGLPCDEVGILCGGNMIRITEEDARRYTEGMRE